MNADNFFRIVTFGNLFCMMPSDLSLGGRLEKVAFSSFCWEDLMIRLLQNIIVLNYLGSLEVVV